MIARRLVAVAVALLSLSICGWAQSADDSEEGGSTGNPYLDNSDSPISPWLPDTDDCWRDNP